MKNKAAIQTLMASLPEAVVQHIQHLERMRQDFVANVSHELRTPLTVIHGYLESLLDQDLKETRQWKKIFRQMQQQSSRMENLIEDLLLLSRLETHNDHVHEEEQIDTVKLLTAIIQEAKELSAGSGHKIKFINDKNLMLIGNPAEIRSLFSNIIFNAVKYTPKNGHITIEWTIKNNQAYFKVTDTGIGIAAKHIPRLTERFYRVDPARSRASGGTGLGLAIAKHVLIRHQGKLSIHSKLGEGSVFTCNFPKKRTVLV